MCFVEQRTAGGWWCVVMAWMGGYLVIDRFNTKAEALRFLAGGLLRDVQR